MKAESPRPLVVIAGAPKQVSVERVLKILRYCLLVFVDLHEQLDLLIAWHIHESHDGDQVFVGSLRVRVSVQAMLTVDDVSRAVGLREMEDPEFRLARRLSDRLESEASFALA